MIPLIAYCLIRALHATLRVKHVRVENLERTPRNIIIFWHAHLLLMLHAKWRGRYTVMISRSKDGEYISRVMARYGVDSARGSSTRGGTAALREMIRDARDGKNLAFTPDGPKGPARVVKDGLVIAAQATGMPVVPIAFAAKKKSCCARGTASWSRTRSHTRSSSTASRSSCRVRATSRSGGSASRMR